MSYKIGAVSTARIADDAITSDKIASDAVVADGIATGAVVADGIAENAVTNSELAINAVNSDSIQAASVTSAKLASAISIEDLTVTGDLSVIGNTSSITLEEVQVDQAKIILNREDSTAFGSLSGNVGLVVKGGTDKDIKMVFDKPAGKEGRVNFQDESDDYIPLKAADIEGSSITCTGDLTLGAGANQATYASGSGTITAAAFSGPLAGAVTGNVTGNVTGDLTGDVTGDLTGDVTGNVTGNLTGNVTGNTSGSSGSCTGNSATASKWADTMTLTLGGDLSGAVSFDGSTGATLTASIGANSLELGTATTGNYVATVAAASGTDALVVSGSGSETASVELSAHALLETAVDAIAGSGFAGGQEYIALATADDTMTAFQLTSIGKTLAGANTGGTIRDAAGLGDGYTSKHGFLAAAGCVLVESCETQPAGHNSYDSGATMAQGKSYKGTYLLQAMDADGTALTSQVDFTLPLIDNSDTSATKMRYGQKIQIKVTGELGSGGSIRLTLPSGKDAATKIDGETTFSLTEQYQAVTLVAGQDNDSKPQYYIV